MASSRADEVAEILWELKRAGKIAMYSHIARRAGFNAGSNGRAMLTCLRTVRRDWPHLQWWRAVQDNGTLEKEQANCLKEAGFPVDGDAETVAMKELEIHLMQWEVTEAAATPAPA